jgi:trimethylamine:corrinoid methyltransferase-like protein
MGSVTQAQHSRTPISSMYRRTINRLATGRGEEHWFETTNRVRQGSVLSPLTFILYMDKVIKKVAEEQQATNILAYSDDIAQIAQSEEEL